MNEWKTKCVGLQRTLVSKRTVQITYILSESKDLQAGFDEPRFPFFVIPTRQCPFCTHRCRSLFLFRSRIRIRSRKIKKPDILQ